MAYDTTKLTNLQALKSLAQRLKDEGGEANVIESVTVNGTALTVTDKTVNVTVPTTVSELTNDSGYQTNAEVATAIQTAIAATGHASFTVAAAVPTAETAEENILYLVKNTETGYYDIYALVSGEVVLLDDTTIDLSNYSTTEEVEALLAETVETATEEEVTEMLAEVFGA